MNEVNHYDAIIIGAGAAGLMAAIEAGKRSQRVLVVDHARVVGRKLLVSGGGKCNVTNRTISSSDYFGNHPSFCAHALKNFTPSHCLQLLKQAHIEVEEREHGRIFCKHSAEDLVAYLEAEVRRLGVTLRLGDAVDNLQHDGKQFTIEIKETTYTSDSLLIATGGLAWAQIGATDWGMRAAKQLGHKIIPPRPALVGFVLPESSPLRNLQGINLEVQSKVAGKDMTVKEPLLFTHRGLSGPASLQLSCAWEKGDTLLINFLPNADVLAYMHNPQSGKLLVKNLLATLLPDRLLTAILPELLANRKVAELAKADRKQVADSIHAYAVAPASLDGFTRAETTLGGVDTAQVDPNTMQSLLVPNLYFAGEVLDVAGRLGGYNIHWAFASGRLAGKSL